MTRHSLKCRRSSPGHSTTRRPVKMYTHTHTHTHTERSSNSSIGGGILCSDYRNKGETCVCVVFEIKERDEVPPQRERGQLSSAEKWRCCCKYIYLFPLLGLVSIFFSKSAVQLVQVANFENCLRPLFN